MTKFEQEQPLTNFFKAGQKAFSLGVHSNDNPYKNEPFRSQWLKGYKKQQRLFNFGKWHNMR